MWASWGDEAPASRGPALQATGRLADPSAQDLLAELEQQLAWGGIPVKATMPVRAFANRSIVSSALVRPDSLAAERQAEALETAIVERRRIELERYASVASFADGPSGLFRVWPLQLLFHTIGWYLVYEEEAIGTGVGLIRSERLDRLALRRSERGNRRSDEAHAQALRRLDLLLHHSGGIDFGHDLRTQQRLSSPNARLRARQLVTLRFCCQGWAFAFIREGLQRYPIEHSRFSRPLPGDHWWHHPNAPTCSSPAAPPTAIPTRWSSTCPPGPWRPTSTCAPGCWASGPASASRRRRSFARSISRGWRCINRAEARASPPLPFPLRPCSAGDAPPECLLPCPRLACQGNGSSAAPDGPSVAGRCPVLTQIVHPCSLQGWCRLPGGWRSQEPVG